jgi:hypothetical protein
LRQSSTQTSAAGAGGLFKARTQSAASGEAGGTFAFWQFPSLRQPCRRYWLVSSRFGGRSPNVSRDRSFLLSLTTPPPPPSTLFFTAPPAHPQHHHHGSFPGCCCAPGARGLRPRWVSARLALECFPRNLGSNLCPNPRSLVPKSCELVGTAWTGMPVPLPLPAPPPSLGSSPSNLNLRSVASPAGRTLLQQAQQQFPQV